MVRGGRFLSGSGLRAGLRSRLGLRVLALVLLAGLAVPAAAGIQDDDDGDGVPNGTDSCIAVANPQQADTDADGFGNACDCDFDQDGRCGIADFNVFLPDFITGTDGGTGTDMDGNGSVGIGDFNLFLAGFSAAAPGPSGQAPDGDGDGRSVQGGDCDDTNASIVPGASVVDGACDPDPLTPNDCNPGVCFADRGPFRDSRETDGCSNPVALDPNNPTGSSACPDAAFATGDAQAPRGCDLHDFCYRTCGSSKAECDQSFLRNLLAICNSLPPSESACFKPCQAWANSYFAAVDGAPAAEEAWTRNQGLYCSCCGGGDCGDAVCDPTRGENFTSCPQDCPPVGIGGACIVDADCVSGQCSFAGRCIQCGDGRCDQGEFCGASPGCAADCGLCGTGDVCRGDADCQSGFCESLTSTCQPCRSNGNLCARDAACCTDICNAAFLCASCKDNGQACLIDGACCSGICNNAFQCASCKSNGQACLTNGVCCSGICNTSFQCASCKSFGQICSSDSQCCSGNCGVLGACGL